MHCNFQDAYALCRIFKKSAVGPKTGEQYTTTRSVNPNYQQQQWTSNHHHHYGHSSTIELSSEGRGEDLESTSYPFPPDQTCSPDVIQGMSTSSSFDFNGSNRDGKWMQYLADDQAFGTTTPAAFPSHGQIPYLPSKVNNFYKNSKKFILIS